jgi:hypothetical protein
VVVAAEDLIITQQATVEHLVAVAVRAGLL